MILRSILCWAAIVAVLAASPDRAVAQAGPPSPAVGAARVVLIGARWCAPCRAELASLPDLVAAAAPARVALGWIDRAPMLALPLKGSVEILPVAAAQDIAERHGAEARGLPFAVAYRADGKPCTVWRGVLHPADWPKLERQCNLR